jgi:Caspase domain/TPM domain/Glucodextranase, domain B
MRKLWRRVFVLGVAILGLASSRVEAQARRGFFRNNARLKQERMAAKDTAVVVPVRKVIPVRRRVLDAAEVLLPEQERDLERKIWKFETETNYHLAILLGKEFRKGEAGRFFTFLARRNRITPQEKANTVLIIAFVGQKVGRIEVGENLQSVLPPPLRKQIIQQRMMRRFRAGQIYAGVNAGLLGVMTALKPDFQPYAKIEVQGTTAIRPVFVEATGDTTPPTITITQPPVTRGMKLEVKDKDFVVQGTVTDSSGVYEVSVNGVEASITPTGEFSAKIRLGVGDNLVSVKAIDTKNNIAEQHFSMTREAIEAAQDAQANASSETATLEAGKYYALVIGIDKYSGEWPQLTNATHDASGVAEELTKDYKFDKVITLLDEQATRANILRQMEWLTDNVKKNDNVLIFYSGHGDYKKTLNKGFWVPVDASTESVVNFISNSDIQTFLGGIPSKHTLLIADACFSGDIFRGMDEHVKKDDMQRYYAEVEQRASRQAMSSGGLEPVMDGGRDGHSVFTYYLLKALKENTASDFDAGQLYDEIKIPVANNSDQTPIFNSVKNTGDEGGQFVFRRK